MKFLFPELSAPIAFEEGFVSSLVIENASTLRRLLEDIYTQQNGGSGFCVLSESTVIALILIRFGRQIKKDKHAHKSITHMNLKNLILEISLSFRASKTLLV